MTEFNALAFPTRVGMNRPPPSDTLASSCVLYSRGDEPTSYIEPSSSALATPKKFTCRVSVRWVNQARSVQSASTNCWAETLTTCSGNERVYRKGLSEPSISLRPWGRATADRLAPCRGTPVEVISA